MKSRVKSITKNETNTALVMLKEKNNIMQLYACSITFCGQPPGTLQQCRAQSFCFSKVSRAREGTAAITEHYFPTSPVEYII